MVLYLSILGASTELSQSNRRDEDFAGVGSSPDWGSREESLFDHLYVNKMISSSMTSHIWYNLISLDRSTWLAEVAIEVVVMHMTSSCAVERKESELSGCLVLWLASPQQLASKGCIAPGAQKIGLVDQP